MNPIELFNNLIEKKALFQLSDFAFKTLKDYEADGYIDSVDTFVTESVKDYFYHYSDFADKNSLDKLKPNNIRPIFLKIPKILLLKLWWLSLKLKNTQSEIINEALSYSMPSLISHVEDIENYRLEIALKEDQTTRGI